MEEVISLIDDSYELFRDDGDAAKVKDVIALEGDIARVCASQDDEMDGIIRDLKVRIEELERDVSSKSEQAHEYMDKEQQMLMERGALERSIHRHQKRIEELKATIESMEEESKDVNAKREQVQRLVEVKIPMAKYEVSLLSHITKVSFSYTAMKENPNCVSGRVFIPYPPGPRSNQIKNIIPFHYSCRDTPKFEIANSIWQAIE